MKTIRTDRTVLSLAFSPDGGSLVSGGWKHTAFWDLHTGACFEIEQDDCLLVPAVTFSIDGTSVLWTCRTESGSPTEVRCITFDRLGRPTRRALRGNSSAALGLLPDGSVLVVGDGLYGRLRPGNLEVVGSDPHVVPSNSVSIWQSPAGPVPVQRANGKSSYTAFGAVPDGTLIARSEAARLTAVRVGSSKPVFAEQVPGLSGIAFSPDGRLLIACADRCVRTWETSRWSECGRFDWEIGSPVCVAVSPDGLTAAASGYAGDIIVWDLD